MMMVNLNSSSVMRANSNCTLQARPITLMENGTMSYLMIRNPGDADPAAFTLLGVSTTRYAGVSGTIGQYGSGSKNALAKFLRENINPVIVPGNLKMEFFSKPKLVSGQTFNQVCVKYSGKDLDGTNRSSTEDLGFTLEWGVQDWTKIAMAFREFVSNAIDGAALDRQRYGCTDTSAAYKDVEFEVVDKPRAKAGYTAIFLPLTPEIQECWKQLGTLFLHYSQPHLLNSKILPKLSTGKNVLIYKKGVLVSRVEEESVFDYNLGDELSLDESRNAQVWDVRYACSKAISSAESGDLVKILKAQIDGRKVFESKFETNYINNDYDNKEVKEKRAEKFKAAFKIVAGNHAVLVSGKKAVSDFVQKKGFEPVKIEGNWFQTLQQLGIETEDNVLEGLERDGMEISEPTADMILAVDKVWSFLDSCQLLNGREKPPVKGFTSVMSGEAQTMGLWKDGTVYLHTDLAMGSMLLKVALEECVHCVTGAGDMSRDLQDYLFRLIIKMWF